MIIKKFKSCLKQVIIVKEKQKQNKGIKDKTRAICQRFPGIFLNFKSCNKE